MVVEEMERFIERLFTSGVACPGDLLGCSSDEIAALECKYGLRLPQSYALFLSRMGYDAGRLSDGLELLYKDVLRLTEDVRASWERIHRRQLWWEGVDEPPPAFPHSGLIICMRPGLPEYWLILCEGQQDSPVIRFDYEEEPVQFIQTHDSLFDFLEMLRQDRAQGWV